MGTSKGYIAPTKPEWSEAKRAISGFLRNRDSESKAKAVGKYASAMLSGGKQMNTQYATAVGNVISFARGVSTSGVDQTLIAFGREDLIGKNPSEILDALIDQFTNNSNTLADSLSAEALTLAFDNLEIESPEDIGTIGIDALLREMVTEYINLNFDLRYEEKIGRGRVADEKYEILKEMHEFISSVIYNSLSKENIENIDFAKLEASDIVINTLEDAYNECVSFYGEN